MAMNSPVEFMAMQSMNQPKSEPSTFRISAHSPRSAGLLMVDGRLDMPR